MIRQMDLSTETDGKHYELTDIARIGCNDCSGCSKCCHDMGNSIVLDPYDVFRLSLGTQKTFEELMAEYIELSVYGGVILPNIKMNEKTHGCGFLDENGRCSIHPHRPGICRIFPLGRMYENGSYKYIYQINECPYPDKTDVKIGKWIDTELPATNKRFICDWHFFLKAVEEKLAETQDEAYKRQVNMWILNRFYILPYNGEDSKAFYDEFNARLSLARRTLCLV